MNAPDVDREITVRELRWILAQADGEDSLSEAREAFAAAEQQAVVHAQHLEARPATRRTSRGAASVEPRRSGGPPTRRWSKPPVPLALRLAGKT